MLRPKLKSQGFSLGVKEKAKDGLVKEKERNETSERKRKKKKREEKSERGRRREVTEEKRDVDVGNKKLIFVFAFML